MLSGAVRPNVLQYVKEEINDDLPTIPMERPEIDAPVLNTYGSG